MIIKKLKSKIYWFFWWYKHVVKNVEEKGKMRESKVKIPLAAKWKYNRLGFTDRQYALYNLKENDYHQYLTHRERYKIENINSSRRADILVDKVLFDRIFGSFVKIPETFCYIRKGKFYDLHGGKVDPVLLVGEKKDVFCKPSGGPGGGTGVYRIRFLDEKYFVNDKEYTPEELLALFAKLNEYIVTSKVTNHQYSDRIFGDSVNTIRIVTALIEGEAKVLVAMHRFGTKLSAPVDNACSGGVFSMIHTETGMLTAAKDYFHPQKEYVNHPDTDARIKDVQVPKWNEIQDRLVKVHNCFPYYDFFAWDVILDDQGDVEVLEINRGTGIDWIQCFEPLREAPLGEYLKSIRVIK